MTEWIDMSIGYVDVEWLNLEKLKIESCEELVNR